VIYSNIQSIDHTTRTQLSLSASKQRFLQQLILCLISLSLTLFHNHHFMALCLGLPRWAGTRRNVH